MENNIYISYQELKSMLAKSKEYPCGALITKGQTEHEIIQNDTLVAVINAIERCEKHEVYTENIVKVPTFINSLKRTARKNNKDYSKSKIKFTDLEEVIRAIGKDKVILK